MGKGLGQNCIMPSPPKKKIGKCPQLLALAAQIEIMRLVHGQALPLHFSCCQFRHFVHGEL